MDLAYGAAVSPWRTCDGGSHGSATAEIVAALDGAVRVLALTTFDDAAALYGALAAGASGFLLKNSTPEDVLQAIRVAAGDAVLDPTVTGRVFARVARRPSAMPSASSRDAEHTRRHPPIPGPSTGSPHASATSSR